MGIDHNQPLIPGGVYKIAGRNIRIGVFNGNHGFTGIREKFGTTFLDTEVLWEEPWHGTVRETPREHIADLVPWVKLDLYLGVMCVTCRHPLAGDWRGINNHACGCDCETTTGLLISNQQLYNAILPFISDETKTSWARSREAFKRRYEQ